MPTTSTSTPAATTDTTTDPADGTRPEAASPWWRDAVVYQVYVRSFQDTDGDGVGDLPGVRARLPYLSALGVDALWLTPFYPSPMADHGYDVADPRDVDPLFGSLADADALVADAHALGLRVLIDLVPNHTSDQHAWFQEALAASPGSAPRERYLFRDGRGADGDEPPNNWRSEFGGPAWTRIPDGQWYLHLFAPGQPDLNWRHPEVGDDAERTLRFWLDRGVDGFRIDVAHGLFKAEGLPDQVTERTDTLIGAESAVKYDRPEVHDVYRRWRRVLDSYDGDRTAVGEVWLSDAQRWADYLRPDELPLSFGFALTMADWSASAWREAIGGALDAVAKVDGVATWVLGNHDVVRPATRYGSVARARAAALVALALPGAYFLYQGDELGLQDVEIPPDARQDPMWERTGKGRDGCRAPMPWNAAEPAYGFSSATPWLPTGAQGATLSADAQAEDALSTLVLYRGALAVRHRLDAFASGSLEWRDAPGGCLAFDRPGTPTVRVVANLGDATVEIEAPGRLILASAPVGYDGTTLSIPADTAVWLAPA